MSKSIDNKNEIKQENDINKENIQYTEAPETNQYFIKAMQFVYNSQKQILDANENKLNQSFKKLKEHTRLKLSKLCKNQADKLKQLKILQDSKNTNHDEDDEESYHNLEQDSLYSFILLQRDSFQDEINEFTSCVSSNTTKENDFVDLHFTYHEKISMFLGKCKTQAKDKYEEALNNKSLNGEVEGELMTNYQNCLMKGVEMHTKFTKDYENKASQIIKENSLY